jgi:hypothetical protein
VRKVNITKEKILTGTLMFPYAGTLLMVLVPEMLSRSAGGRFFEIAYNALKKLLRCNG